MPIQVIERNLISGQVTTFKFAGKVLKKAVGIRSIKLVMPDAHVKILKISLSVNQNAENEVSVQAHVALADGQAPNGLDLSESYLHVNVLAWTGTDATGVMLQNAGGIVTHERSRPFALPSSKCNIFQSFLSGLDMSFPDDDHHVATISAGVGTEQDQSTGYVTAVAVLADRGGNIAKTSVDAGVIANSDAHPGFSLASVSMSNTETESGKELTFPKGTKSAWPLLESFEVTFANNEDHHLNFLQVEAWKVGDPNAEGKVVVKGACWMGDTSCNREDKAKTSIGMIVLGY